MRFRWKRVIGIFLFGVFTYLFFRLQPFLNNLIEIANQDVGYQSPVKAIMLGTLCITFLAGIMFIVKR